MEVTFKDYLENRFYLLPDFTIYEINSEGQIVDLDAKVSPSTIWKINKHIKDKFFNEVRIKLDEACKDFNNKRSRHEKEYFLITDEQSRINGLISSTWNTLTDISGQEVKDHPSFQKLPITWIFNISENNFLKIRQYLAYRYNQQDEKTGFITDIAYNNLAEEYILAEVLLRYMSFIDGLYNTIVRKENVVKQNHQEELAKEFINKDFLNQFYEFEERYKEKGYLSQDYIWKAPKTRLLDFIQALKEKNFLKVKSSSGKPFKDFHYRRFISNRYGLGGKGLSQTCKDYKPNTNEKNLPIGL